MLIWPVQRALLRCLMRINDFFLSFIQEMFDITGTGQWQAGRQAGIYGVYGVAGLGFEIEVCA